MSAWLVSGCAAKYSDNDAVTELTVLDSPLALQSLAGSALADGIAKAAQGTPAASTPNTVGRTVVMVWFTRLLLCSGRAGVRKRATGNELAVTPHTVTGVTDETHVSA